MPRPPMMRRSAGPRRRCARWPQRFDTHGPRYTSYPTADRFHTGFGTDAYLDALHRRAAIAPALHAPLSLYVHLPFCANLC